MAGKSDEPTRSRQTFMFGNPRWDPKTLPFTDIREVTLGDDGRLYVGGHWVVTKRLINGPHVSKKEFDLLLHFISKADAIRACKSYNVKIPKWVLLRSDDESNENPKVPDLGDDEAEPF